MNWIANTYVTVLFLALVLLAASIVAPFFLVGVPIYIGVRLYLQSPGRLERLARHETQVLYDHAKSGRVQLSDAEIDAALSRHWSADVPPVLKEQLLKLGKEIFADEGLSPDIPPMPALCNTIEGGRYRDQLVRIGQARHDRTMLLQALDAISRSFAPVANAALPMEGDVLVGVTQFVQPLGTAVQNTIAPFFEDNDYALFKRLRERLDTNLSKTHATDPIFPSAYKGKDVVGTYLAGTLLARLFSLKTPFVIPDERRFEHMHMVAGSGHGKTQTLQYFIANDLEGVAGGEKSVILIDSQGDFINTILRAKHLPPERIVLIDPEDIHYPVCLNLFSAGQERLKGYDALEQERLTNSIIELYDFVLGSLLASGMTGKQSVIFRYVTRLMFHIPDATIHTLRDLLEPKGADKYQEYIKELSGTPRRFFEAEFNGNEFKSTKTEVLRRIYGMLENQTFERMFSYPQSKFDMFSEMNEGKLILVNTAKSLLKEEGAQIFGRFFIALIAQAAQERATLPQQHRLPCMVYIDEASDYFDQNIGIILSQARKYKVGMTLAHQYLGQLGSGGLLDAFDANTSIKLVGGVSAKDARTFSNQMNCAPELVQDQPKGTFATAIRGLTKQAVPMSFPFFVLEDLPRASKEDIVAIRQQSRERYAEPLKKTAKHSKPPETDPESATKEIDGDDPTVASPEL